MEPTFLLPPLFTPSLIFLPPHPLPFCTFIIPLTRELENVSIMWHNAYQRRCCSIGRIGGKRCPPLMWRVSKQPWMVCFGIFFIFTGYPNHYRLTRRPGKPLTLPATIITTETTNVLLCMHLSLMDYSFGWSYLPRGNHNRFLKTNARYSI